MAQLTDIEIAQSAKMQPIAEIAKTAESAEFSRIPEGNRPFLRQ